jgi:hypothetical protein
MRKEGRTDMTKSTVVFSNFANAPKNSTFCQHSVLYWFKNKQWLFPYTASTGWFLGAYAILRKATICFVMPVNLSVLPHGTTALPLDGFSWNLMSILKIGRENSSFFKYDKNCHWLTRIHTNIYDIAHNFCYNLHEVFNVWYDLNTILP